MSQTRFRASAAAQDIESAREEAASASKKAASSSAQRLAAKDAQLAEKQASKAAAEAMDVASRAADEIRAKEDVFRMARARLRSHQHQILRFVSCPLPCSLSYRPAPSSSITALAVPIL